MLLAEIMLYFHPSGTVRKMLILHCGRYPTARCKSSEFISSNSTKQNKCHPECQTHSLDLFFMVIQLHEHSIFHAEQAFLISDFSIGHLICPPKRKDVLFHLFYEEGNARVEDVCFNVRGFLSLLPKLFTAAYISQHILANTVSMQL